MRAPSPATPPQQQEARWNEQSDRQRFAGTKTQLGWITSSQHWLTLLGSPLLGWMIGRYGVKVVVVIHCVAFLLGAIVMATLADWRIAVLWGSLKGLEAQSVNIARQYFLFTYPPSRRGTAAAIVGFTNKVK